MGTLKIHARHVDSVTAVERIRQASAAGEIIGDDVAVTVASWWQSSGSVGSALAALASGAQTTTVAVRDDIDATIDAPREEMPLDDADLATLQALRSWVDSKVSEHYVIGRNMAGYLPESEPTCYADDWSAAVEALADDMREYADDDDDSTTSDLQAMRAAGDEPNDDDAPAMRATVDSIIRDEIEASHRAHGSELEWLIEDGSGCMISFWLHVIPASECEAEHDDI